MAGRIPRGGQELEEVELMMTTIMAVAAATATVEQQDKELGSENASATTIPLTMTKMRRTARKKEGGQDAPPPF